MWSLPTHLFRRFTKSLSFKLSFYAGLIVFVALVAFAWRSISEQENSLIQERIQSALNDSEVIKAALWNGMLTKDRDVIREIVKAVGGQEGFKEINVYDHKGVLHYASSERSKLHLGTAETSASNPLLKDLETNTTLRYRFADDGNTLNVINPLRNTKSCSTAQCHARVDVMPVLGALEVNLPLAPVRGKIRHQAEKTIVFAFLLFLFLSTVIGLGVILGVLPPIKRLRENARSMARGQYSPRAPIKAGSDEIGDLARSFDEMSRQTNERTRQLEESRRMFKELFDKVPCYLTVINPDYRIVRANQTFVDEFGDQVGKSCFTGFKGSDERCPNCQVEKTFQDGLPHRSEEVWNLGGSGKKAYVIVYTAPIFDANGNVLEVLEMSVDVTRVERLQMELRKKEEQFRKLIELVPCYLTVIDRSFRIAFYNKVFAQDFGDSWGKNCFAVCKGRDSICDNCPVAKTFEDGASHSTEEVWRRNGKEIHIVLNTSPITEDNGEIVAVMEMCTNITELRLLQNELSILGETVAGMSHTVKNVLAGLEGGVYVVDSGLRSGKEEKVRLGWQMVKKNVEKVSDLVKDILYASKERQPDYVECAPGKILSDVYDLYKENASANRIELVREFETEMGSAVIDAKGFHTIVSNLVSNAVAACSADIGRDEHRIILSSRIERGNLLVRVADDGGGMPEQVKQNLFKKFYSTKGAKGTGLGLVVTRKIVEEHGGTINYESVEGQGTSFTVEIPLKPPSAGLQPHKVA